MWTVDLRKRGAAPVRLTAPATGAPRARWGSGGTLHFLAADARGVKQLWRTTVGGQPAQLTQSPIDVGAYRLPPDGKHAVAVLKVFADCPTLACTADRLAERRPRRRAGGGLARSGAFRALAGSQEADSGARSKSKHVGRNQHGRALLQA